MDQGQDNASAFIADVVLNHTDSFNKNFQVLTNNGFTVKQVLAMCDLLNGTILEVGMDLSFQLIAEFEDVCDLLGIDKKWGIKEDETINLLENPIIARCVCVVVGAYWVDPLIRKHIQELKP